MAGYGWGAVWGQAAAAEARERERDADERAAHRIVTPSPGRVGSVTRPPSMPAPCMLHRGPALRKQRQPRAQGRPRRPPPARKGGATPEGASAWGVCAFVVVAGWGGGVKGGGCRLDVAVGLVHVELDGGERHGARLQQLLPPPPRRPHEAPGRFRGRGGCLCFPALSAELTGDDAKRARQHSC